MSDERITGLGARVAKILADEDKATQPDPRVKSIAVPGLWLSRRVLIIGSLVVLLLVGGVGYWLVRRADAAEQRRLEAIRDLQQEVRRQHEADRLQREIEQTDEEIRRAGAAERQRQAELNRQIEETLRRFDEEDREKRKRWLK